MSEMPNQQILAAPTGPGAGTGANSDERIECGICYEKIQSPQNWKNLENCSHGVCTACFPKLPRTMWGFEVYLSPGDNTTVPRVRCPYCRSLSNCEPYEITHPQDLLFTAATELDLVERAHRLITMANNYLASSPPSPTTTIFKLMFFYFKIYPSGDFEFDEERRPWGVDYENEESEGEEVGLEYLMALIASNSETLDIPNDLLSDSEYPDSYEHLIADVQDVERNFGSNESDIDADDAEDGNDGDHNYDFHDPSREGEFLFQWLSYSDTEKEEDLVHVIGSGPEVGTDDEDNNGDGVEEEDDFGSHKDKDTDEDGSIGSDLESTANLGVDSEPESESSESDSSDSDENPSKRCRTH